MFYNEWAKRETEPNKEKCFLEEGIICIGLATRAGCEAKCINANMPCTGCMGPCPEVKDQGAKMISALSSVLGEKDEITTEEVEKIILNIKDPIGTFYRYTLATSFLSQITK